MSPEAGWLARFSPSLAMIRAISAGLVLLLVPALLSLGALREGGAIEVGTVAPRTIVADETITVVDEADTLERQRQAAAAVTARTAVDPEAGAAIVNDTREIFAAAADVRTPREAEASPEAADPGAPAPTTTPELVTLTPAEQEAELAALFPELPAAAIAALVAMPDDQLQAVRAETVPLAVEFARIDVTQEDLGSTLDGFVAVELPLLAMSSEQATTVTGPILETVARPTIIVDADATETARQEAAAAVEPTTTVWQPGDAIVTQGLIVDEASFEALQQAGLEASSAPFRYLRALGAMVVVVMVLGVYLWQMQPRVWRSPRKLLLLSAVMVGYAGLVAGVSVLADPGQVAWWYLVPVGALAMLVALLVHPVVAIASMLPAVVMVTLSAPLSNGVAVFTAAAVLTCVPLTIDLGSRGDLRSAALRAGLAMPVIAAMSIGVFGPRAEFWPAVGAAALNGLLITLLVQGLLPFLETTFRLPTVTALLDLADRNHPLMRELETKAIGSYNHSVMVASLTERACREIGANPLLGSVAALYHDIGKVRRPHFFIENQYGITNPHDDLEPQVSALIIQEHVIDGVRMATEYRLPPEVVAAIASHHGTMVVSYFYNKAVEAAGGDASEVDEGVFRYKGTKPRGKEAAVLLIADCSEAATRAMAMDRGTLPRGLIESTVDKLVSARIDDGQFDESDLTFDELRRVRDSVVAALEGIYHPRIAYPSADRPKPETLSDVADAEGLKAMQSGSRGGHGQLHGPGAAATPAPVAAPSRDAGNATTPTARGDDATTGARADTRDNGSPPDETVEASSTVDEADHDAGTGAGRDLADDDGGDDQAHDADAHDPHAHDPHAHDARPSCPRGFTGASGAGHRRHRDPGGRGQAAVSPASAETDLATKVHAVVAGLGPGELVTYGEVAHEIGHPGAARAVGTAMRSCPPDLPWWRVVPASGRLHPRLLTRQVPLLRAEGVMVVDGRIRPGRAHPRHTAFDGTSS